jgi:hypothetical protein
LMTDYLFIFFERKDSSIIIVIYYHVKILIFIF